ncbi:hypothetical protein G4177_30280 [Corallococcus sp. ZKHCc1 1396]|uniref:Uncharacterized protein n=1 Tax=Corallococcus soli TaxID=2710757 RepID=A0ABR9PX11_9BACT|nr:MULTISPECIES: hypothetical protein [Corallococcus]MBE4752463.1 hypothetical protein [Corallococcus soli]MCY1033100.1 hypothetical protein [Corallococcus sp. BB11-1]
MSPRPPQLQVSPVATKPAPAAPTVYVPPAILWEQPFVALAQISACNIPGESECVP